LIQISLPNGTALQDAQTLFAQGREEEAYRKGHILPTDLLQPTLAEKVQPLFLRGDHDVAVFQSFKEVEVAVRSAANKKGANYPDDLVGVTLMRKAFHPETRPVDGHFSGRGRA